MRQTPKEQTDTPVAEHSPLKFVVAPHIVQDLGLNLYTSLPRVLVEFVANAYDADSPRAKIAFDKKSIDQARDVLRAQWELDKTKAKARSGTIPRLAERTLPDHVQIVVQDEGHGMTRSDLQKKFLVAGRRRREEGPGDCRSPGGRVLMGRKGLGKLAGFGVAQVVTVVTKVPHETHATSITLDYRDLIGVTDTNEIPIKEERLPDGGGLGEKGTRIVLSRLLYEPMKSRSSTIEGQIADHFAQIDPANFLVEVNGDRIMPTPRPLIYAWPEPEKPIDEMVDTSYQTEDGRTFTFQYRLRFTADHQALAAKDRGVRIYAHKRLAAAPSLLEADTNMHGFRMTDYLDGVVYADFIDDQPEDYIATDRQALRWESPLLQPMHELLCKAIKTACYQRQKARDTEKEHQVRKDEFTRTEIEKEDLTRREQDVAYKIAATLSTLHKKGYDDDGYRDQFSQVIRGLGRGEILTTLSVLAKDPTPDFDRVIAQVTRLTADQLDGFYRYVKGRLDGIEALRKIVHSADFRQGKNEAKLHGLFNKSPWLIDPMFFEFLTSNASERTLFGELEKTLQIGSWQPTDYDSTTGDETDPGGKNLRPDLVFILGNTVLSRIVIVELKAPNTPLHGEHYRQLQRYVRNTEKWLKQRAKDDVKVEGLLIGSMALIGSRVDEVEWLQAEIEKTHNQGQFRVFSIDTILERAELVHKGLMDARLPER